MNSIASYLADHWVVLLTGSTCLLAAGALGNVFQRSPIHRQRTGEAAALGVLIWLACALVPLPRISFDLSVSLPRGQKEITVSRSAAETFSERPRRTGHIAVLIGPPHEPKPSTAPLHAPPNGAYDVAPARPEVVEPPGAAGRDLAAAYIVGASACAAWLALGCILLGRVIRTANPPQPWFQGLMEELSGPGNARPRLLVSPVSRRALTFGLWRPTIVVPLSLCTPGQVETLRHVLLHELSHVRQRDAWGLLLFNLAFPLLYFNPLSRRNWLAPITATTARGSRWTSPTAWPTGCSLTWPPEGQ